MNPVVNLASQIKGGDRLTSHGEDAGWRGGSGTAKGRADGGGGSTKFPGGGGGGDGEDPAELPYFLTTFFFGLIEIISILSLSLSLLSLSLEES